MLRQVPLCFIVCFGAALTLPSITRAQALQPAPAPQVAGAMVVDITLERKKDGKVEQMAPGHVFEKGDILRLRLRSHYNGFLYVLDQGTTGKYANVFPSAEAGSNNRVHSNQEYLVPAVDQGWFEVEGPAGFDVLYFLLSPTPLATPAPTAFTAPAPPSSLKPRCNDDQFRARGECMDDSAGPVAVPRGFALPAPLQPMVGSATRDLKFVDEGAGTVGVTGPQTGEPVLYAFRLAHL